MDICGKSIPPELVLRFVKELRSVSREPVGKDFIIYRRVCRLWCTFVMELWWTDMCLKDDEIEGFVRCPVNKNVMRCDKTKSLTILIDPVYASQVPDHPSGEPDRPPRKLLSVHLRKLPARLRRMTNLSCFSFKMAGNTSELLGTQSKLRAKDISDIVESLSRSVKHLEIDTSGHERFINVVGDSSSWIDVHLCPEINSRLAGLRSLRLKVSHLCADLMNLTPGGPSNAASCETSISINTCGDSDMDGLVPCWYYDLPLYMPQSSASANSIRLNNLVRDLLDLFVSSGQPGKMSCVSKSTSDSGDKSYDTVVKRAVNPATTMRYPHGSVDKTKRFLRKFDENGSVVEMRGMLSDIIAEQLEDHSWRQTDEGFRFPDKYLDERLAFKNIHLKPSLLEHLQDPRGDLDLAIFEPREGRYLLRPRENHGIDEEHLACISRDKTTEERAQEAKQAWEAAGLTIGAAHRR